MECVYSQGNVRHARAYLNTYTHTDRHMYVYVFVY